MNDLQVVKGNSGEIDIQVSTAKMYPRVISEFRQKALTMATSDQATAASCFYSLKRGGTAIQGPSVRLAEIIASSWGNLQFGARIIEENDRFIVAQGAAWDLESNVRTTQDVRRRITGKDGKKYSDDMIAVTANAACSIALRNAIFKTVPFTYAQQIYEAARKVAVGDAKTIGMRRQQMVAAFAQMGVELGRILNYCGKANIEDIDLADIENLIGEFNAIKEGETTIEDAFPEQKPEQKKEGPQPLKTSESEQVAGKPTDSQSGPEGKSTIASAPVPETPKASMPQSKSGRPDLDAFNQAYADAKNFLNRGEIDSIMKSAKMHDFPSKNSDEQLRAGALALRNRIAEVMG